MTRLYRSSRLAILAATGWLATACADSVGPLAPAHAVSVAADQAAQASLSRSRINNKTRVRVLTRRDALDQDYLASAHIGSAGGSIEIDKAGVTITFPRHAVAQETRITVRALAGNAVAYEFEPHGLTFAVKPTIEQDLDKTNWKQVINANLEGVYFADPTSLNRSLGEADADEMFVATTKGDRTLSFSIAHFSGYLVSSARR